MNQQLALDDTFAALIPEEPVEPEPKTEPNEVLDDGFGFFGLAGERHEIAEAVCTFVKSLGEGQYGERWLVKLRCQPVEDGPFYLLTWFATVGGMKQFATYRLSATIKRHSIYEGRRETQITRVRAFLLKDAPSPEADEEPEDDRAPMPDDMDAPPEIEAAVDPDDPFSFEG